MRTRFLTAAAAACLIVASTGVAAQTPDSADEPGPAEVAGMPGLPELPEGVTLDEAVLERAVQAILTLDPTMVQAILPSPDEALSALAQFESSLDEPVAWRSLMLPPTTPQCADVACVGIYAGAAVTDFLLALRARDAEAALLVVAQLREAAPTLGISEELTATGDAIALLIADEDWAAARGAMDRAFAELSATGNGVDPATASLIGTGAWLRSVAYVGSYLGENYTEPASRILRQGVVAQALSGSLQRHLGADPAAEALIAQLLAVGTAMDVAVEEFISPERVAQIAQISRETLSAMEAR